MKNILKLLVIGLMLMGSSVLPGCTYYHGGGGWHGSHHGGWHR